MTDCGSYFMQKRFWIGSNCVHDVRSAQIDVLLPRLSQTFSRSASEDYFRLSWPLERRQGQGAELLFELRSPSSSKRLAGHQNCGTTLRFPLLGPWEH